MICVTCESLSFEVYKPPSTELSTVFPLVNYFLTPGIVTGFPPAFKALSSLNYFKSAGILFYSYDYKIEALPAVFVLSDDLVYSLIPP